MIKVLPFLFLILSGSAYSQEETTARGDYRLDSRYKGGQNLIFDCVHQHYACVDNDSLQLCKDARAKSMKVKTVPYACAPLETFTDKKTCLIKNYRVIEKNAWKRFCFPK